MTSEYNVYLHDIGVIGQGQIYLKSVLLSQYEILF